MIFQEQASLREKLAILADAAKYDVACTSSGVERHSPGHLYTGGGLHPYGGVLPAQLY